MKNTKLEEAYRDRPLKEIPWNFEAPPRELVELIQKGRIKPCKAIDLGCGTGNYALYLAERGFEMTGVDSSLSAIQIAKENAKKRNLECDFLVMDVLENFDKIKGTFDFVYDWLLLHHIYPKKRKAYCGNVNKILNQGGKYLSVCFSEKDRHFGGSGKYRETSLGTTLYFSSEKELRNLFVPFFQIEELKTIEVASKSSPHLSHYAFMTRAKLK
ncbi:MAG: class I SAM-dependent methyltransferase [Candidatus Aminicenantes bacterium]|nr:class I SAM-dependent methyltransferase [Candidatus Aminicenantes bacterium]